MAKKREVLRRMHACSVLGGCYDLSMFAGTSLNPLQILTLIALGLSPFVGIFFFPPSTELVVAGFAHFLWFGLASSLYYHRVLCHKAAKLAWPLEVFFLLGGLIGISGDPVQWSAIHRYHHQNSDKEVDPHSPLRGFWYALFGWYLRIHPSKVEHILSNSKDLSDRKLLRMVQGSTPTAIVHGIYTLGVLFYFGITGVVWLVYVPIFLSYLFAWALIATLCHLKFMGEQPYPETQDRSRNVSWLTLFTFGESLHNTHHRYASAAYYPSKWYEIDLSGQLILIFKAFGLASDVKRLPETSKK